jgi:hypothetical protein
MTPQQIGPNLFSKNGIVIVGASEPRIARETSRVPGTPFKRLNQSLQGRYAQKVSQFVAANAY